ncbi:MAG: protein kinase [Armatimonadetes bacterium]|nr:protein kinase [Armatimonadota bacterium]
MDELSLETLLQNRYEIKKLIASRPQGNTYLAKDKKITDKNWIIKELIPSIKFSPEELKLRREKLYYAIESLQNYNHPNLAKILEGFKEGQREYIVMENIEGISLEKFYEMSANPFPEEQVLKWALEICEALYYLHDRPQAFIFDVLEPSHIILQEDNNIKLVNFGLDRFFDPNFSFDVFTLDLQELSKEYNKFGETLYFLLTKKNIYQDNIESSQINPELIKIIYKCLDKEASLLWGNWLDIKKEIVNVLHPGKEPVYDFKIKTKTSPYLNYYEKLKIFFSPLFYSILSQKATFLLAEILALILLPILIYQITHPKIIYIKKGPVIYILYNHKEIDLFDLNYQNKIYHFAFEDSWDKIAASLNGKYILLSQKNNKQIKKFHPQDNTSQNLTVDLTPTSILAAKGGKNLYIIQEKTNNLSQINLIDFNFKNIIPLGKNPQEIVQSKNGLIFVSNYDSDSLSIINPDANLVIHTLMLEGGPKALLASKKTSKIFCALKKWDKILVINSERNSEFEIEEEFIDLGGRAPESLASDNQEEYLYVANQNTHSLGIIDLKKGKLKTTLNLKSSPLKLVFAPPNNLWILQTNGEIALLNTLTNLIVKNFFAGKKPQDMILVP